MWKGSSMGLCMGLFSSCYENWIIPSFHYTGYQRYRMCHTVRLRERGTSISEASKRGPIFVYDARGGMQVSSYFDRGTRSTPTEAGFSLSMIHNSHFRRSMQATHSSRGDGHGHCRHAAQFLFPCAGQAGTQRRFLADDHEGGCRAEASRC